jgi:hypothetical protein
VEVEERKRRRKTSKNRRRRGRKRKKRRVRNRRWWSRRGRKRRRREGRESGVRRGVKMLRLVRRKIKGGEGENISPPPFWAALDFCSPKIVELELAVIPGPERK